MIYNKNNLIIQKLCSKDDTRPGLTGVLFKKDRTVATDSCSLLEVTNAEPLADPNNLPKITPKSIPFTSFPNKGILIPQKSVKKVLSNLADISEKDTPLPILQNCWFIQPTVNNAQQIVSSDLIKTDIVMTMAIDEQFPDYQQIIPKDEKKYRFVKIDIRYLKNIVEIINSMELAENYDCEIGLPDDLHKPLLLKTKTKQNQIVTGLLMPIGR